MIVHLRSYVIQAIAKGRTVYFTSQESWTPDPKKARCFIGHRGYQEAIETVYCMHETGTPEGPAHEDDDGYAEIVRLLDVKEGGGA